MKKDIYFLQAKDIRLKITSLSFELKSISSKNSKVDIN